jgi:4-hydroxybenzoate polyprenyltransferase
MLKFISFSGIFIAIAAICYSLFYTLLLDVPVHVFRLIIIFFATLGSYIAVQLLPLYKAPIWHERQVWFKEHYIELLAMLVSSALAILIFANRLNQIEMLNFFHLFLIVVFYEKIIIKNNELRKIPYLKPFLIAYVWAGACTLPQLLNDTYNPIIFTESFLFILALTIPFDIRDNEQDRMQGLKTLVHILGEGKLKILCFIIFTTALAIGLYLAGPALHRLFISLGMLIFYSFLLGRSWNNQHDYYFLYGMDSLIILKLLLLL